MASQEPSPPSSLEGNKPGFPKKILANNLENKHLCKSCQKVLRRPLQAQCGHRFCSFCFHKIVRCSHGDLRIASLLFADDVVLLASSARDLQLSLDRFAAACEAAGMRISTSKSEAMVLSRKKVECLLRVKEEILPQVEEFKYLGVLFTSKGRMEREIDRRIGAASTVMRTAPVRCGDLPVDLRSYPHLWS
ncbi:TNF receptor-associated factor 2 [Takifugu flavidus]|uniref:TNF receptor-associated factor 2 n=1 Tax=Takifugu flavidus TaxID=433684 RepID=A0A5C6N0R6_9TELE|nr:TNF receptor-associated factor 2 [Takifugu flavidus]